MPSKSLTAFLCLVALVASQLNLVASEIEGLTQPRELSSFTSFSRQDPQIALGGGKSIIVWLESGISGSQPYIVAQVLDETYSEQSQPFIVNDDLDSFVSEPRVEINHLGGAVFSWIQETSEGNQLAARTFTSDGLLNDKQILVTTGFSAFEHSVASSNDGSFVFAIGGYNTQSGQQVLIAKLGNTHGNLELLGPIAASGEASAPRIVSNSTGGFKVAFSSVGNLAEPNFNESQIQTVTGGDQCICLVSISDSGTVMQDALTVWIGKSRIPQYALGTDDTGATSVLLFDNQSDTLSMRKYSSLGSLIEDKEWNEITAVNGLTPSLVSVGSDILAAVEGQPEGGVHILRLSVGAESPQLTSLLRNSSFVAKNIELSTGNGGDLAVAYQSYKSGKGSQITYAVESSATTITPSPVAYPTSQTSLQIVWNDGFKVHGDSYQLVEKNGRFAPITTNDDSVTVSGLAPGNTYELLLIKTSFNGIVGNSETVVVTTWGIDENGDGLPDEWQAQYWSGEYPSPAADTDGDGSSNLNEFLAGTDPTESSDVLALEILDSNGGRFLTWRANPGSSYQVELSSDLDDWNSLGLPFTAVDELEVVPLGNIAGATFFRIILTK